MGWTADDHLWETSRGGELYFASEAGLSENFEQARLGSRGFGVLDVGYVRNLKKILTFINRYTLSTLQFMPKIEKIIWKERCQ